MTTKGSRRRAAARSTAGPRPGTVLLAGGLGLLVLVPAAPAWAAEESSTVRWAAPDATVRGTEAVKARVSSEAEADGWLLRLLTADGGTAAESLCSEDLTRPRRSFSVECRWDTVHAADGRPAANQHYLLRLMTRTAGGLAPVGEDRAAAVANPATAPGQVARQTTADGRTVLSWAANPEPDIVHYDVEERVGTGRWTRIGEPAGTSFEPGDGPGRRMFRVAAERRGPDGATIAPTEWTTFPAAGNGSPSRPGETSEEGAAGDTSGTTEGKAAAKEPGRRASDSERSPDGGDKAGSPRSGGNQRSARRDRSGAGAGSDAGSRSRAPGSRAGGSDAGSRPGSWSRGGAAPAPTSGGRPDKRDGSGAGDETPTAPGRPERPAGEPASTGSADTPPADQAGIRFSESSAAAFGALASPAGSSSRPATGKAAPTARLRPSAAARLPEPDPGFGQTLPYAQPDGRQDLAAEEQAAPATPPASIPGPPTAPEPLSQQGSNGRQRAEGLALAAAGFAVLGFLARPSRRSRRRPAIESSPAGEPAALAELAARVASIEARLGGAEPGTR